MTIGEFFAIAPFAAFGALVGYAIWCDMRRALRPPSRDSLWMMFPAADPVDEVSDSDVEWPEGVGCRW